MSEGEEVGVLVRGKVSGGVKLAGVTCGMTSAT